MVGILVSAVALGGISTMAVSASAAIAAATNNSDRVSYLRTQANSLALNPQAVPVITAATTTSQLVDGHLSPVTIWRTSTSASTTIFVAMPRWTRGASADCSQPQLLTGCLTAQASITASGGGSITTTPIVTSWSNPGAQSEGGATMAPGPLAAAETEPEGGQATPNLVTNAQSDLANAYAAAETRSPSTEMSVIVGGTLPPGNYKSGSSLHVSGVVTLDGQNNPNSVFVFQAGSTLTTASYTEVRVINGAQPSNVFWQVGSSATLGTFTKLVGSILAHTSITVTSGCVIDGRALALGAAVTLDTNNFIESPVVHAPLNGSPPSIDLGAAGLFSVLGATAVTNTGPSQMSGYFGSSSGTAGTGFPPSAGPPAEMRYVLRIKNATANGSLVFTDSAAKTTVGTIHFLAGGDEYFYGAVHSSGPIEVSLVGASATISHVYFYKPPA